jgi:hypothetical protein
MPRAKEIDQVAISPDGKQVAYMTGGELSIIPQGGGSGRTITVDGKLSLRDVSWSRDSTQITFIADLSGDIPSAQIFTATLDGSAPVKRAEVKGYASMPSFLQTASGSHYFLLRTYPVSRARCNP